MKKYYKPVRNYTVDIDPKEIAQQLHKAGYSKRKMAHALNEELDIDDAYRKWKKWMQKGRMPKHKMEKMNGIIRRVASENKTA